MSRLLWIDLPCERRDLEEALKKRAFMIAGRRKGWSIGEVAAFWRWAFESQWLRCSSNQALQATPVDALSSADADGAFWLGVPELGRSAL